MAESCGGDDRTDVRRGGGRRRRRRLNGALMLARSRRSVLVVDAGPPAQRTGRRGARTARPRRHAAGGAAGHGRAEVRRYGGEVVEGEVIAATGREGLHGAPGRRTTVALAGCWSPPAWSTCSGRSRARASAGARRRALPVLPRVGGPRPADRRAREHPDGDAPGAAVPPAQRRRRAVQPTTWTSSAEPARAADSPQAVGVVDGAVTAVEVRDDRIIAVRWPTAGLVNRRRAW